MKTILLIALIFLAGISYGQFVPQPIGGNPGARSFVRGALSADSGFVLTQFPDTLTANKGPDIKRTHGLMIQVHDSIFVRNIFRSQWVRLGSPGGALIIPPASGVVSISFDGYSLCWINTAGVETCYPLNNLMTFVPRADSSYTDVITNGIIVDSIPSFLTPIASGDTCILIRDSSNGVKYFYQNPNCKGSGGGSGPTVTASNGLTKVVNDIQLSGTLLAGGANINATVDNNLSISSTDGTGSPHGAFRVNHTGTMEAAHIFNSGGVGLHVSTQGSSALALFAAASGATGVAVYGQNTGGGYGGEFISQGSVAGGIKPALFLVKTSGSYADGTGVSIAMSGNGGNISNTITSKWTTNKTNVGNGFSVMEISGHQNGTDNTILSLSGNGATKYNKYGLGTFTGTAAYNLAVTSSGDMIEVAAGGGGGGVSASNFVVGEIPSGTVNGTNQDFTLAFTPVLVMNLYSSGVNQNLTSQYTIAGTTIHYLTAPLTGTDIRVNYIK